MWNVMMRRRGEKRCRQGFEVVALLGGRNRQQAKQNRAISSYHDGTHLSQCHDPPSIRLGRHFLPFKRSTRVHPTTRLARMILDRLPGSSGMRFPQVQFPAIRQKASPRRLLRPRMPHSRHSLGSSARLIRWSSERLSGGLSLCDIST